MILPSTRVASCFYNYLTYWGNNECSEEGNVIKKAVLPIILTLGAVLLTGALLKRVINPILKVCNITKTHDILNITDEQKKNILLQGGILKTTFGKDLILHREGTVFYNENNSITMGGVLSGELRYPHLIQKLWRIKKKVSKNENLNVMILGPGLSKTRLKTDPVTSSQLHEILAAFPKNTKVIIIDRQIFVCDLDKSTFGHYQREAAESVFTKYENINLELLSSDEIDEIKDYVKEIPETIEQALELHQQDFVEFEPEKKSCDYIFATQSLLYPVHEVADNKEKSLKIIDKYLAALKVNGRLVIDGDLYNLMRDKIQALPNPMGLGDKSKKMFYKKTPFKVKRLKMPNKNKLLHGLSCITYDSGEKTYQISTDDIFFLKRIKGI